MSTSPPPDAKLLTAIATGQVLSPNPPATKILVNKHFFDGVPHFLGHIS